MRNDQRLKPRPKCERAQAETELTAENQRTEIRELAELRASQTRV
jgi:hypothetical protein